MGLRFHKVVGYGLTNLGSMHGNIVDERFDRKLFQLREEAWNHLSIESRVEWLQLQHARIETHYRSEMPHQSDETFARLAKPRLDNLLGYHKFENRHPPHGPVVYYRLDFPGLEKALVFQPFNTFQPWSRDDDLMDLLEDDLETHSLGCVSRIRPLRVAGIDPFGGMLIRHRTADSRVPPGLQAMKSIEAGLIPTLVNSVNDTTLRALCQNDFDFCWRPPIPYAIVALLTFLEPGIKDVQSVMYDLRPVVMTYWE